LAPAPVEQEAFRIGQAIDAQRTWTILSDSLDAMRLTEVESRAHFVEGIKGDADFAGKG
jgi:hypothetical protein